MYKLMYCILMINFSKGAEPYEHEKYSVTSHQESGLWGCGRGARHQGGRLLQLLQARLRVWKSNSNLIFYFRFTVSSTYKKDSSQYMHSYFIAKIRTTFNFHRNVARHHAQAQMQTKDFGFCLLRNWLWEESLKVNITSASVVLWISTLSLKAKWKKTRWKPTAKRFHAYRFHVAPSPCLKKLKCICITEKNLQFAAGRYSVSGNIT
jgi:hypothetical protein